MPNVVDKRRLIQRLKIKPSEIHAGPQLVGVLKNHNAAMEQVFAATHGRPMTDAERRRFKETGD